MSLRKLTGGQVAASAWLMPDQSIAFVKLSQKEYEAGKVDTIRPPDPLASFVMAVGGIPALDSPDGYPSPGDYWEQPGEDANGLPITVLHYQTGSDLFGNWSHELVRQKVDARGVQQIDAASGQPLHEYTSRIGAKHRDVLTTYDLKAVDQIVPNQPTRLLSLAVTPVPVAASAVVTDVN